LISDFEKLNYKVDSYTEVYTFTDQPATCPKCGSGTKFIEGSNPSKFKTQQHTCLSVNCLFEFIMQNDDE